jgi:nucleoside-diphosphate-sugar epimerase
MKAFVAGATGFIGGRLVDALISRGIGVRILIRDKNRAAPFEERGIECLPGSIGDAEVLRKGTKDVDFVFSTFGLLGRWGIPERKYREVNVDGVQRLIASCREGKVKQFIHLSSAGVLGPMAAGQTADESFPYHPTNSYERSKVEAEKRIVKASREDNLCFTVIRPEFVYGPGDRHVLKLFRAVRKRRFYLLGSGRSLLHPTYIDDLIGGIGLCLDNPRAMDRTFLITGDKACAVKELAGIIAGELGIALPRVRIPLPLARAAAMIFEAGARIGRFQPPLTLAQVKFFSENRVFSWRKAQAELGYTPRVDLKEGVKRTVRWYFENGCL